VAGCRRQAGAVSGAPAGFSILLKIGKKSDRDANGQKQSKNAKFIQ
jgi:hypothetical protein